MPESTPSPAPKRRHLSPEQKAAILRRHLVDKVPVSDLCDEHQLRPSVLYGWLQQAYARLELTQEPASASKRQATRERALEQQLAETEARLARKDAIIADISEEHLALKKNLAEPEGALGTARSAR